MWVTTNLYFVVFNPTKLELTKKAGLWVSEMAKPERAFAVQS